MKIMNDKQSSRFVAKTYQGNPSELKVVEEFGRDYRPHTAVWWYTRECFTYQMLNRALRCLEGDIIVDMGFFIHDLHRQPGTTAPRTDRSIPR